MHHNSTQKKTTRQIADLLTYTTYWHFCSIAYCACSLQYCCYIQCMHRTHIPLAIHSRPSLSRCARLYIRRTSAAWNPKQLQNSHFSIFEMVIQNKKKNHQTLLSRAFDGENVRYLIFFFSINLRMLMISFQSLKMSLTIRLVQTPIFQKQTLYSLQKCICGVGCATSKINHNGMASLRHTIIFNIYSMPYYKKAHTLTHNPLKLRVTCYHYFIIITNIYFKRS